MDRRQAVRYVPAAAFAASVLVASVVDPSGGVPSSAVLGLGADKWLHLATYATLALLLAFAALARTPRVLAAVVLLAAAYGGGIEAVQSFLPARTCDLADAAANAAGALLGAGAWYLAVVRRRRGR